MIPVKIQCGCGQKYAFDVEPVNGRMSTPVACPICGVDGTSAANDVIARSLPPPAPPPAVLPPSPPVLGVTGTRFQRPTQPPPPVPTIRPAPAVIGAAPKERGEFNLGMGILGAFSGAAVGVGLMYGFFLLVGFRFPLLGVGIGFLTGLGAKLLYKGTDNTLGFISAGIAMVSVVGTLFLMYGEFPIISIISVVVSVSMAYRIASG